jgi:hypothetical protein
MDYETLKTRLGITMSVGMITAGLSMMAYGMYREDNIVSRTVVDSCRYNIENKLFGDIEIVPRIQQTVFGILNRMKDGHSFKIPCYEFYKFVQEAKEKKDPCLVIKSDVPCFTVKKGGGI